MRHIAAALAAGTVLALTACSAGDLPSPPGEAKVDVDTPALRALKSRTSVEPCSPGDRAGGGLPELTLSCLGGGRDVDLDTLRGPMVVNLWASNCGPCR